MMNILAVFVAGGLGCLARYGVSSAATFLVNSSLPLATLISNVLSCAIFGAGFYFFPEKMSANSTLRLLLITGFCGGFSTFSAFSFETVELFRTGNLLYAIVNILVSVGLCCTILYFTTTKAV